MWTQELMLTPTQFGIPNSRLRYYLLAKQRPLSFCFETSQQVSAVVQFVYIVLQMMFSFRAFGFVDWLLQDPSSTVLRGFPNVAYFWASQLLCIVGQKSCKMSVHCQKGSYKEERNVSIEFMTGKDTSLHGTALLAVVTIEIFVGSQI